MATPAAGSSKAACRVRIGQYIKIGAVAVVFIVEFCQSDATRPFEA